MAKKHHPQLTFIAQAEIKVQEVFPKEKKEKGTLITFSRQKNKKNVTYLRNPSRLRLEVRVDKIFFKKKQKKN